MRKKSAARRRTRSWHAMAARQRWLRLARVLRGDIGVLKWQKAAANCLRVSFRCVPSDEISAATGERASLGATILSFRGVF